METENVQYWKYHNQNFTIGTSSSFGSPVGSAIVLLMIFFILGDSVMGDFKIVPTRRYITGTKT